MEQEKNQESQGSNLFFKNFARLVVYTAMAGAFFFVMAVMVFSVRTRDPQRISMQELVGKYYIDVHNDLSRSRIRIHIKKRRFEDKPPGIILYQSLPAGATLRPGDSVTLTVNQPEPVIRVPELVESSLDAAESVLKRINYDDEVYSLEIGAITHVPVENVPEGTIVAQFPAAGDLAIVQDRVFLLISTRPGKKDSKKVDQPEDLKGQNVSILNEFFRLTSGQYQITKTVVPSDSLPAGTVTGIEKKSDSSYGIEVAYEPPEVRFQSGYEKIQVRLPQANECQVVLSPKPDATGFKQDQQIYQKHSIQKPIDVDVVFFRRGSVSVKTTCDHIEVDRIDFYPDFAG